MSKRLHIYWAWPRVVRGGHDRRFCPWPALVVSSGVDGGSVAFCWLALVIEWGWTDVHKPTARHG